MSRNTAIAGPSPERLCGDCGYRLHGLPVEGRCPECGAAYGPDQLVLFGWAGESKANLANCRAAPRASLLVAALVMLTFLAATGMVRRRPPPAVALIAAGAVAAFLVYYYRSLRSGGTPPVQLRLGPDGVAQRDGVGPVTEVEPWRGRWAVRLVPHRTAPHRFRLVMAKSHGEVPAEPREPVDFDFNAGPTALTAVRHCIESNIAAAGGTVDLRGG